MHSHWVNYAVLLGAVVIGHYALVGWRVSRRAARIRRDRRSPEDRLMGTLLVVSAVLALSGWTAVVLALGGLAR
jgi:hypothetical protein